MTGRTWAIAGDTIPLAATLAAASEDWAIDAQDDYCAVVAVGLRSGMVYLRSGDHETGVEEWAFQFGSLDNYGTWRAAGPVHAFTSPGDAIEHAMSALQASPAPDAWDVYDQTADESFTQLVRCDYTAARWEITASEVTTWARTGQRIGHWSARTIAAVHSGSPSTNGVFALLAHGDAVLRDELLAACSALLRILCHPDNQGPTGVAAAKEVAALRHWAETVPASR